MPTIIRREIRKRGFFGSVFKWLFVIFNLLMCVWMVSYWVSVGSMINEAKNEVFTTGAAAGATIGTTLILFFWAAGSIVLGLLTMLSRGRLTMIEERVAE